MVHDSIKLSEKRKRELLEKEFARNHLQCLGKTCQNCQETFKDINSFNNHINMCNYVYQLEPSESDVEPDVDFNYSHIRKFLARKNDFLKYCQRDLQVPTTMCNNCCKNDCGSECEALLCENCGHRYNFFLFLDHYSHCRQINQKSKFCYFAIGNEVEKSEVIKTKELIQQLQVLSLSSSSDSCEPRKPKIRLTIKKRPGKSRTSKLAENNDNVQSQDPSSNTGEQHFYQGTKQKDSDYDDQQHATEISDENEYRTDRSWASYKRKSRETATFSKDIEETVKKVPEAYRSGAFIKNNAVNLNHIKNNLRTFHASEFLKKQMHFILIDRSWTDNEQAAYYNFFGLKKKYVNELLANQSLEQLTHRTSYKQQYKNDEIELMLEYILVNSTPSADHLRTMTKKKIDKVQNRVKQEFYR